MLVTPTGHVYEMYAPHQGGQAVRVLVDTESITWQQGDKQGSLPVIAGSASLKEKTLFVTLTNAHATAAVEVDVNLLGGAMAARCRARILTSEIHSHNTFEQPEAIQPAPFEVTTRGSRFTVTLPAASVTAVEIELE